MRWIAGAVLVMGLMNVLSYGAMTWLNGAGLISPYTAAALNRTAFYPLFAYKESMLPGANAVNEFYVDCLTAGSEFRLERDDE